MSKKVLKKRFKKISICRNFELNVFNAVKKNNNKFRFTYRQVKNLLVHH